jgi:hypothetical protein
MLGERAKRTIGAGWASVALLACRGPLPAHGTGAGPPVDAGALSPGPRLIFEPPPSVDGASAITRLTLELDVVADDVRVMLVSGELSAAQLRDLARPALPMSLAARANDVVAWVDDAASAIHVAPLSPLAAGALYTLGVSSPPIGLPFQVAPASADPVLSRLWPPPESSDAPPSFAVWCGAMDLPSQSIDAVLEPAHWAGRFRQGTGASIAAPKCIRWESDVVAGAAALPALSPPALTFDDGTRVALEPVAMSAAASPAPTGAAPCADGEIAFGRGCAEIQDDRAIVRSPGAVLLWTIDGGGESVVRVSRAAQGFVLRPLPADSRYRVATLDAAGHTEEAEVLVVPAVPRSHAIINEVMANPAGAEPAQEWVELYNDGSETLSFAGYTLDDGAAPTALPDGDLGPGAFALVVSQAFLADDGVDPAPAPSAALLRVRSLGQSGLSNEGERLTLRDASGAAISVFPALKTKNGVSAARVVPDAPDDDEASFTASPNGSATPGAPNGAP